jgi:hypothetical protein
MFNSLHFEILLRKSAHGQHENRVQGIYFAMETKLKFSEDNKNLFEGPKY